VFQERQTWLNASLACEAEGGRLAQITNAIINDWISQQTPDYGFPFFSILSFL